jgi:outer membrane protein OmpA-like peptidoglycan-associated protein
MCLNINFKQLILLLVLLPCCSTQGQAQASFSSNSRKAIALYTEADNYRVRRQYGQAITLLESAIKKDGEFIEAYIRLGGIYKSLEKLTLAESYYTKAIDLAPNLPKYARSYFYLAEILITSEQYDDAKISIEKFLTFNIKNVKIQQRASLLLKQANYAIVHMDELLLFTPTSLNSKVNQFAMQYFPVTTADENYLLYTKRDGDSPYDDEDIMISTKDDDGEWGDPESISQNINSQLNEGTCAISADGRTLIFTSCQGRNGYGSCDLFISYKVGLQWSIPENMGDQINSSAWESQPSLSADGRMVYFVSNRKGGVGGRDIWLSTKENANWGAPKNLGRDINTVNEEVSPFIHSNGKVLYFASDGMEGYGGFDIYNSELDSLDHWNSPTNIGYPINRGSDQMSLIISPNGTTAYYSDSGAEGKKLSEIKTFDIPEEIRIKNTSQYVQGTVRDKYTSESLGATLQLYDLDRGKLLAELSSDSVTAEYLMVLTNGGNYALYVEKQGYIFQSINFDFQLSNLDHPINIDFELKPIKKGESTVLNNIFFEHDSFALNDESKVELGKVAKFIIDNNVKLEIGGYTDSTGSADYNQGLSLKRAKAVYEYLVDKRGIPQSRLAYHGYGQANSINSDNQHKARRIEFTLL